MDKDAAYKLFLISAMFMNFIVMHVLEKFRYCPVCGSSHFEIRSEKSKKCDNCGFEYFMNASAATAAFILNTKGELLVMHRRVEPAKGMLDLPGGFCDIGETAEEGIRREVKEETGLEISNAKFLFTLPNVYRYSGIDVHTLDHFYLCEAKNADNAKAMDDEADIEWMSLDDIKTEHFGLRSIRQALYEFLKCMRSEAGNASI